MNTLHRIAKHAQSSSNVIDIFTGKPVLLTNRIVRVSPEFDGMEILYTNDSTPNKLYSLKIVCWALREDGEVVGMVPWLNDIVAAPDINDPLNGRWEGYRDPGIDSIFYQAPAHKVIELQSAADYYEYEDSNPSDIIQEIPDSLGTHAVLTANGFQSFSLVEVLSWRLLADGSLQGMLIDADKVKSTPVLPGDACLFPAQSHRDFRYFFQHRIANKIKERDPEAMAAISLLIEE